VAGAKTLLRKFRAVKTSSIEVSAPTVFKRVLQRLQVVGLLSGIDPDEY
jgi:hypothetical protein